MINRNVFKKDKIPSVMSKVLSLLVFTIFLINFVSADLGTFTQGDCVQLLGTNDVAYMNISLISYPNATIDSVTKQMTRSDKTFSYNFCDTNNIGKYTYNYYDEMGNIWVNDFWINPTGQEITTGQSVISAMVLLLILSIGIALLFAGNYFASHTTWWFMGMLGIALGLLMFYYSILLGMVYLRDIAYSTQTYDNLENLFVLGTYIQRFLPAALGAGFIYWWWQKRRDLKKTVLADDGWDEGNYDNFRR